MSTNRSNIQTDYQLVDFDLATEITNKYLMLANQSDYVIEKREIEWQAFVNEHGYISSYEIEESFFGKICRSLSPDYRNHSDLPLFHFQSPYVAKQILASGLIHASSLDGHSAEDAEEYRYLLHQIGHPLVRTDREPPSTIAKNMYASIEDIRSKNFISCFTRNMNEDKFWMKYAKNHTGVCLVLQYNPLENYRELAPVLPLYNLRGMIYDNPSNDRFSFVDQMNLELQNRVGYQMLITPIPAFAKYYKRFQYCWENEIRFSIDLKYLMERQGAYDGPYFEPKNDNGRRYLEIPIKGFETDVPYDLPMELELVEIICGKEMSRDDRREIYALREQKFSDTSIR